MFSLSDVSVVVLSYNRLEELKRNLPILCKKSIDTGFEIIIVDNASTDGSCQFIGQLSFDYPAVISVFNDKNLGVAGGRNVGWSRASRRYILNVDDDTWIDDLQISALLHIALKNCEISVFSPRILHAITLAKQCDFGEYTVNIANFHGACHMLKREVYLKVGEIDRECSFGGEELDYSIRLKSCGFNVLYIPDVTIRHNSHTRSGFEDGWRRRQWVFNFARVLYKHFPLLRASILAWRYSLSHVLSGRREHGILFALSLFYSLLSGAVSGRRVYCKVPIGTLKYYSSADLRPEFGNVSIFKKIVARYSKFGVN
jgi:GT2 family glycosyltransferase